MWLVRIAEFLEEISQFFVLCSQIPSCRVALCTVPSFRYRYSRYLQTTFRGPPLLAFLYTAIMCTASSPMTSCNHKSDQKVFFFAYSYSAIVDMAYSLLLYLHLPSDYTDTSPFLWLVLDPVTLSWPFHFIWGTGRRPLNCKCWHLLPVTLYVELSLSQSAYAYPATANKGLMGINASGLFTSAWICVPCSQRQTVPGVIRQ